MAGRSSWRAFRRTTSALPDSFGAILFTTGIGCVQDGFKWWIERVQRDACRSSTSCASITFAVLQRAGKYRAEIRQQSAAMGGSAGQGTVHCHPGGSGRAADHRRRSRRDYSRRERCAMILVFRECGFCSLVLAAIRRTSICRTTISQTLWSTPARTITTQRSAGLECCRRRFDAHAEQIEREREFCLNYLNRTARRSTGTSFALFGVGRQHSDRSLAGRAGTGHRGAHESS